MQAIEQNKDDKLIFLSYIEKQVTPHLSKMPVTCFFIELNYVGMHRLLLVYGLVLLIYLIYYLRVF